jgi:hypothetical protein
MAEAEIRQFISHLAVDARISASTQTVALSALLFLYRAVLKKDLPYIANIDARALAPGYQIETFQVSTAQTASLPVQFSVVSYRVS